MTLDRDQELWACALAVEKEHGDSAVLHAAMQIDRFDTDGNAAAAKIWREVLARLISIEQVHGAAH
ncbi:DUF6961 family protein [Novosphingobium aquiterrae]|uniref:DUF6961 family protein n=1 Tax=Novosphingobium aquiterrae TaxID=624388 RepID=A0ABV6PEP3_9SPHN